MISDPADTFRQEARELLESLEQSLLDLERVPSDQGLIDSAFRALHTIKGSGAMFGFDAVAGFVHEFETAFDRVRKGQAAPSHALIAVALSAKDHIHKLIETPDNAVSGGDAILDALRHIVEATAADGEPTTMAMVLTADSTRQEPVEQTWRVKFRLSGDALVSGTNPLLLLDEMRGLGPCRIKAVIDAVPPLEVIEPEVSYLAWDVVLTTESPRSDIEDVFMFLCDGMDLDITEMPPTKDGKPTDIPLVDTLTQPRHAAGSAQDMAHASEGPAKSSNRAEPQPLHPKPEPVTAAATPDKAAASLRVPAERLDELMDRVGELVIAQARLNQIASASTDANLKTIAEELERLSAGLRDTTMGIRMVPIGTLFGRFRRLVHDLSRDLGKEIEFVTSGEETELDKTVIERLADPLVHLIRNSVDHGLEPAEKRLRSGKEALGTIRLSAVHAGAEVAISVSDDGAGLDAARIRAKAEEAGLISPDAKIADADLFQFLFHPGFSTAREITSLSGRGVGMDVVKRTIESLRGKIELTTVPGQGTTATLRLPLTLAIIDGMLVRVGNSRYTIPLSAVEECVELPADIDGRPSGRNFLNIRGGLVPFLRLSELFKSRTPPDAYQKVVIVSSGEFRVGLVVDQIIGNNQTVIKSLSKLHANIGNFSGATILGDGTVALILDVIQLVSFGQAFEDRLRNITGKAA